MYQAGIKKGINTTMHGLPNLKITTHALLRIASKQSGNLPNALWLKQKDKDLSSSLNYRPVSLLGSLSKLFEKKNIPKDLIPKSRN